MAEPAEEFEVTHPLHPLHPEHPDNTPDRKHHPHAHIIKVMLGLFIIVMIILMTVMGLSTDAPFSSVIWFFAPSILFGLAGLLLITTDHYHVRYMGFILIGILILAGIAYQLLITTVAIDTALALNFIFGTLLLIILAQSHKPPGNEKTVEVELDQQPLPDIIKTIEDRCKALNFVIGRVYKVHKGATAGMRERIKIPPEWYNELSAALEEPEENKNIILGILEKIRRQLEQLHQPEHAVFTETELKKLKKLEREPYGKTSILDVLAQNDSDPVEQYVTSALEYANNVIERLEA